MRLKLSPKMIELLMEAVSKHRPDLVGLFTSQNIELNDSQRDELRQALTDELCETGFREDDEPNERGRLLEDLIDYLAPWKTRRSE